MSSNEIHSAGSCMKNVEVDFQAHITEGAKRGFWLQFFTNRELEAFASSMR